MFYLVIFIFVMICVAVLTKDNSNTHHDSRIGSHYEISHRKDN